MPTTGRGTRRMKGSSWNRSSLWRQAALQSKSSPGSWERAGTGSRSCLDEARRGAMTFRTATASCFARSEISTRYRAGESAERIAYDLEISVTTVFAALHREGAVLRGKCEPHRLSYADVLTEAFLQATYVEADMGAWEIAAEVGCSESTVRNWLRRHGIPVRPIRTRRRAYQFSADLLDQVSIGVVAVEAAAGQVGCSRSELTRALRRAGRTLPNERRVELTRELLVALYVDQSQSCPEISAETGWAIGTVRSRLREFGIPRRIGRPARS